MIRPARTPLLNSGGGVTPMPGTYSATSRGVLFSTDHLAHRTQAPLIWARAGPAGTPPGFQHVPGPGGIRTQAAGASGPVSYLDMWQAAMDRKRKEEAQARAMDQLLARKEEGESPTSPEGGGQTQRQAELEQRFLAILDVPEEQRREAEQRRTVDRAAAALAAAEALLADVEERQRVQRQVDRGRRLNLRQRTEEPLLASPVLSFGGARKARTQPLNTDAGPKDGKQPLLSTQQLPLHPLTEVEILVPDSIALNESASDDAPHSRGDGASPAATRSQGFWSWVPPTLPSETRRLVSLPPEFLRMRKETHVKPTSPVAVLDRIPSPLGTLTPDLPFQSAPGQDLAAVVAAGPSVAADLESLLLSGNSNRAAHLPPLQSTAQFMDALSEGTSTVKVGTSTQHSELDDRSPEVYSEHFLPTTISNAEADEMHGVLPDGSLWWRTSGVETRESGEECKWTAVRGVSADGRVEWEEKWWEAWDEFDYKELGAEKSGRDSSGGVWRERWQEAMWQDKQNGLLHLEKSADKWGQDGSGGEWHEKWWEHYDGRGRAEKWADKWSRIDKATPLAEGHAHIWHERWGEEYDGRGAASKYCDKWAERCLDPSSDSWTKWGDKWDENFNESAHGYRRGETWWKGASGEAWNRTWSEGHNGSGWVHKEGRSSSGERWDVHEPMDTWFERKPHFGFKECLQQSQRLQQVAKKRKTL